jgi:DNA-binding response OmpR family regulator
MMSTEPRPGRLDRAIAAARSHILIVEDEPDVAALIKHTLDRSGDVDVTVVGTGEAALKATNERVPDLIILDLNLPGFDGLEVCRILRARPALTAVPIIMLTARATESDRVQGLDVGADDYMVKPFSPRELAARARAALRRTRSAAPAQPAPADFYRGKHLVADFDAVSVLVDEKPIQLTRREFELLRYLVQNRNRVLSRDRLLERVWGYEHVVETRSVDVHVGRLRGKLGPAAHQIETVVGLGYRFVDQ